MTWKTALLFSAVVLLVGAIGAALVVAIWFDPQRGTMLLEVLKLVVSWPFVLGLLGFAFGITFRSELSAFIRNIGKIRLPGGTEITTQEPSDDQATEQSPEPGAVTLTPQQVELVRQHLETLSQQATDANQQREDVINEAVEIVTQKDRLILYWWCKYLDEFLVLKSKLVLAWFAAQEMAPTARAYHIAWTPAIAEEEQRETILTVLLNFGLISEQGGLLRITDYGNYFLRFWKRDPPTE